MEPIPVTLWPANYIGSFYATISSGTDINLLGGNYTFENDYDTVSYVEVPELVGGAIISNPAIPDGVYGGVTVQGNPVNNANSYFTARLRAFRLLIKLAFFRSRMTVLSAQIWTTAWVTDNAGCTLYDVPMGSITPPYRL